MSKSTALFLKALKGNLDALRFVEVFTSTLHVWDDLQDGDKPVTRQDVSDMMWQALVVLPDCRFYRLHYDGLSPLIRVAIMNWHTANRLEASDVEHDKNISFMLRSSYADVVLYCAFLVGGLSWVNEIGVEFRRAWHHESITEYLHALGQEHSVPSEIVRP